MTCACDDIKSFSILNEIGWKDDVKIQPFTLYIFSFLQVVTKVTHADHFPNIKTVISASIPDHKSSKVSNGSTDFLSLIMQVKHTILHGLG